jgi:isopentenyl-diphosphate delta-isomerase
MGIDADLQPAGVLSYTAELSNGWYENEVVHLFVGHSDAEPSPDPNEVGQWRRIDPDQLTDECASMPDAFTAWFRIYLDQVPKIALLRG